MISIFLLWTFHLYIATFHQHLHMEYISLSWICPPLTFHILIISSESHQPNELKLGRRHLWKILSKDCTLTNMAATGNSCFWLADFFKSSPLKLLSQMNRNLVGSTYGRFCIKFPQSRMKGEQHRLSSLSL
jgi:hypothetical protein